jgi:FixJ family two-component response regulator
MGREHARMSTPNARVAIVDDDAAVRKALARLIRARKFCPQTYGSAREFLASLGDGAPECLVVDLQMPEMNGLDLQYHLVRTGIRIPTIVITAHNEPGFRERCRGAGAVAYLLKPLDQALLIAAISAATDRA